LCTHCRARAADVPALPLTPPFPPSRILAFAIVTPLYSTGSRSATEFTVFYKV
tara:strand:- start:326 stop:484 length:159 start_codon:yes stop_codon:yes gene_type:complete